MVRGYVKARERSWLFCDFDVPVFKQSGDHVEGVLTSNELAYMAWLDEAL